MAKAVGVVSAPIVATLVDPLDDPFAPSGPVIVARLIPHRSDDPATAVAAGSTADDGLVIELMSHSATTLGRAADLPPNCRIVHPKVSTRHCIVDLTGGGAVGGSGSGGDDDHAAAAADDEEGRKATAVGGATPILLRDTSSNGTWLNGKRVAKDVATTLRDGDTISLVNPALLAEGGGSSSSTSGTPTAFRLQRVHVDTPLVPLSPLERLTSAPVPEPSASGIKCAAPRSMTTTTMAAAADLSAALRCSICSDLLHQPVSLSPCNHSFCQCCIVPWLKKTRQCPECRAKVVSAAKAHRIEQLVEALVAARPSLARTASSLAAIADGDTSLDFMQR